MMDISEPIQVVLKVTTILDKLEIPYFIGGSLATAVHGVARATMDADLVIDMPMEHIEPFTGALKEDFFIDEQMIRNSLRRGMSFNILHKETMFKVDFFPRKNRTFESSQFKRREKHVLVPGNNQFIYIASPEDMILAKLEWYKMGGQQSERQWQDILSVMKVQAERLDLEYLKKWALKLRVADLLARVIDDL